MKRLFDFTASLVGLILLSPVLLAIGAAIVVFDGWPALFSQMRVGQSGRPFRIWKFRSMKPERGGDLTVAGDARITRFGAILRACKLDELPQLWNVLKGEMSLVGPRPEVPKYVQLYTESQRAVLRLKPGITDPASFAFYDEAEVLAGAADPERFYIEAVMAEKIRINLAYAEHSGFWSDLTVVTATVLKALGFNVNVFALLRIAPPENR